MSSDATNPAPAEPKDGTVTWRFRAGGRAVELDEGARELKIDGQAAEIEPRPLDLLILLLGNAGEVVTTEEILGALWPGRIVTDVSVANTISKLRKVLGDDGRELIVTVSKAGYRLTAQVGRSVRPRRPAVHPSLQAGESVPGRPQWLLHERLEGGAYGETWIARHAKTEELRVFKFCVDDSRLSALKREVTLFRLLRESLGDRACIPTILEWQFDSPPYFLESEKWGINLRDWIEQKGGLPAVPLPIRIEVLALAAEAVANVHSVGVLHKDLKPLNILVSEQSGAACVRICDFGTGMVLDPASLERLNITRLGFTQTVANTSGTPAYIAPELLSGSAPSVQSDVFALGVTLYQLVTGDWRQLAFGWEADIDDELLKEDIAAATHRDPQRRLPSAQLLAERLRSLPQRREALEQQRLAEARQAQMKRALERSRARRPWVIAAGCALLLGAAVSLALSIRERQAAAAAARSQQAAEESERAARALATFLSDDIVRQASPDYGGHVDVTLKKAIIDSIPKISQTAAESPLVAAELEQSIASTLATLSDPVDAVKLAHEAAERYANAYGPIDRRTLSARVDEATYRLSTDTASGLSVVFAPVYELVKGNLAPSDTVRLKAGLLAARLSELTTGDSHEAVDLLGSLITQFPTEPTPDEQLWLDRAHLAHIRALELARQSRPAREEGVHLLPHFIQTYTSTGRMTLELHEMLGRAYAAVFSPDHDHQYEAAEAEYRIAMSGYAALYGEDSDEVDFVAQDLGDVYILKERFAEVEALYGGLYRNFERRHGPTSFWTLRARLMLIRAIDAEGRSAEAAHLAQKALADARKRLAPDEYMYRSYLAFTAKPLISGGLDQEGAQAVDELEGLMSRTKLPKAEQDLYKGEIDYLRGLLAERKGDPAAARALLTNAVRTLGETEGTDNPEVLDAARHLAKLKAN